MVVQSKYTSGGSIERFKTRLMARGFSQVPGVDLTFASTVRREAITILALIAPKLTLSVSTYIERLSDSNERASTEYGAGLYYQLLKSLNWYIKAIGERLWNKNVIKFFTEALGFEQMNGDTSIPIHSPITKNNWSRSSLLPRNDTTPEILERQRQSLNGN